MRVGILLDRKGSAVLCVAPDASVADAAALLTEHRVGAVVVSTDGRTVLGILSERDVVAAVAGHGAAGLTLPVRDVMTADVHTATRDDDLDSLTAAMTHRRIRHIPVVDAGVMVGIVSIGDVVKSRLDELEDERSALLGYIVS